MLGTQSKGLGRLRPSPSFLPEKAIVGTFVGTVSTLADSNNGFLLFRSIFGRCAQCCAFVVFVGDVVALKNADRLMTADCHSEGLSNASTNQITNCGAPEIVKNPPLPYSSLSAFHPLANASSNACGLPTLPKLADRFTITTIKDELRKHDIAR